MGYVDPGHCCHSHSPENCHVWSGSCPHCRVEWTLLNRKDGGCDETPTASILIIQFNKIFDIQICNCLI